MKILTLLILVNILVVGCEQRPSKEFAFSIDLRKVGIKEFRLDSVTSFRTNYVDIYMDKNKNYLILENRNKPSIQFYDFSGDSLSFEVKLEIDGPNGVGKMRGFFVKNLDSIYVLNPFHYAVYLVNRNGNVIDKYSWLHNAAQLKSLSMAGIYTTSPGILLNNKLHLFAVPETGYKRKSTFESGKVDVVLDLKNRSVELNYNYPDVYRKNMYGNLFIKIDRTLTPHSTIVYSFGADNNIHETNYGNINKSYYAGSSYFKEPIPLKKLDEADDHEIVSGYFSGIKYDRFRKMYYRLAVHPIELLAANNQKNHYEDKRISVIILDRNFKKIGESILPEKLHLYTTWFVAEDGIYISNHNRNNESLSENAISFTIYEPIQVE